MMKHIVNTDELMEIMNLRDGVFAPLQGFMDETTYRSVVADGRLPDGSPWGLPVTLAIEEARRGEATQAETLDLVASDGDRLVARLRLRSVFLARAEDLERVYGTADPAHPGVAAEAARGRLRVGGELDFAGIDPLPRSRHYLPPSRVKTMVAERGWRRIVGFQTRNAVHRAHEYLQRLALEFADGLLIHPLTGWKKDGDASVSDIVASYAVMRGNFYPADRTLFSVLETPMRYAGPREALFHAMIRRNYGCTHFIVGRDHAGVGGYYGKYAAQEFCAAIRDLGIEILAWAGPYHCARCGGLVTERSCRHAATEPAALTEISGTVIREYLARGEIPPAEMMRPEVARAILAARGAAR